jgi:hypothetical protein
MNYKPVTIYGQMVVDHVVHVRHPYESADLRGKAIRWDETTGKIIVRDEACIATPHIVPPDALRLGFKIPAGEYRSRDKIKALSVTAIPFSDVSKHFKGKNVSQLGFPRTVPGGGGTNVSYALYNIFGNIQKQYYSLYSKGQDSVIEQALAPLFPPGGLVILKEDPEPSVNIIVEGIAGDRLIVKSPRLQNLRVSYQDRVGDICMVNTCYSWSFAINGLIEAALSERAGVIACTQSLCCKDPIYEPAKDSLNELMDITASKLNRTPSLKSPSVYAFIRDVIMKFSKNLIYIFNEDELAYFVEGNFDVKDIDDDAIMSGIIRALRWLRGVQGGLKPVLVVTLGRDGALYLDQDDYLHYCRVMTDREMQRVAGEKNAIGDLFAATILGITYGRGNRGEVSILAPDGNELMKSYVPSILVASSAAADSGVYDGFMGVTAKSVSSIIQRKADHYSFLGALQDIDASEYAGKIQAVLEKRLDKMRKGFIRETVPLNQLVDSNLLTP